MARYVVAVRRGSRRAGMTLDSVGYVPGVEVAKAGNPHMVVIEATQGGVDELMDRFGDRILIEPEVIHSRFAG